MLKSSRNLLLRRIFFVCFILYGCSFSAKGQPASDNFKLLQKKLATGWNTWSYGSMLTQVLLPQGLSVKVNFRNSSIGTPYDVDYFLEDITVDKSEMVRPIAHTFDGSYTELIIKNWYGNSIRVQSSAKGEDVYILITPLVQSEHVHFNIELQTGIMWNRPGTIQKTGQTITAAIGSQIFQIRSTQRSIESFRSYTSPYFSVSGDSSTGFYTGKEKSLREVKEIISESEKAYNVHATKFKDKAEAFQGIESVLGWNTLYDAENDRVITPVTRGWNEAWQGYVLFEWDTYFAALLFSLDNKELAYSNAIAISKPNKKGAVGFTQMPGGKVSEQSQPPVGSMICWEIYEKYHEKWFLEDVYNQLLSWNRWWPNNRLNKGYLTWGAPWKNAALHDVVLESGLDNSPMYEDVKVDFVGDNSLMNLADVGLNSLYVADCQYLAKIASALGRSKDEKELNQRAKEYGLVTKSLWDNNTGIYLNRSLDDSESSHRLSPTLFYPMIAGIPSHDEAARMIKDHYYNTDEFYGSYIIPSCARNDKSFNNDYWKGAIWGPMNYLVYKGLRSYDKNASSELSEKSYQIYLQAWKNYHYVFENVNSTTGPALKSNKINVDPFYHWGALLGLLKFEEDN